MKQQFQSYLAIRLLVAFLCERHILMTEVAFFLRAWGGGVMATLLVQTLMQNLAIPRCKHTSCDVYTQNNVRDTVKNFSGCLPMCTEIIDEHVN